MKLRNFFALLVLAFSAASQADECVTTVKSNDAMQFDTKEMVIPASCKTYTVNLEHTGTLDKAIMGHNWVLSKSADAQPIANDAMMVGLDNNYIKPGDDRVIAATNVIGGGESTSVTVDVSKLSASESYTFFCSFPGHIGIMKGTLSVK